MFFDLNMRKKVDLGDVRFKVDVHVATSSTRSEPSPDHRPWLAVLAANLHG